MRRKRKSTSETNPKYAAAFDKALAEGYFLTNYGHGWRYFARKRGAVIPGNPPMTPCETIRIRAKNGEREELGARNLCLGR